MSCIVPILEAFSDLDHCVVNWSEKKEYVKLENERQKKDDVNDNLNLLVLFDTNAANGTFKLGSQNKSVGKLCMKYYYRAAIKEENRERWKHPRRHNLLTIGVFKILNSKNYSGTPEPGSGHKMMFLLWIVDCFSSWPPAAYFLCCQTVGDTCVTSKRENVRSVYQPIMQTIEYDHDPCMMCIYESALGKAKFHPDKPTSLGVI